MSYIHDLSDSRDIEIENVGICNYKLPITFESKNKYATISEINAGVSLANNIKGAHLSRIIKVLDEMVANKVVNISSINYVLEELARRLELNNSNIKLLFNIVYSKLTPISNQLTYLTSTIELDGNYNNGIYNKSISLTSQGAMLCPNSKAISDYGAHSQKCNLKATFYGDIDNIIVEEVLDILSTQFSAEVYGIVKSCDEKMLTEKAYNNPKFSEDLVRDTLVSLRNYYSGGTICAEIENLESIHQHNVYAKGLVRCKRI